jgi:hypothetical protein
MRADPGGTLGAACAVLPQLDTEYALMEWREQEGPSIFSGGDRLGHSDRSGWEKTIAWRREVVCFPDPPEPDRLTETLA